MSFPRVCFAAIAIAMPLLLGSCSTKQDEQRVVIERQRDEAMPAALPDSDGEPEPAVSESAITAADETAEVQEQPDPEAAAPRQKVEERKSSQAARAKGEIIFDDLKFDLETDQPFDGSLLTDEIRQLDGTTVKLRGYILPSTLFSETNISQFVLVRDNQECCFGPGAALFDCVMVEMVPGETTDFVTRPVTVEGKFVIDTESYRYPPGYSPTKATHLAVFRIEGEAVQ